MGQGTYTKSLKGMVQLGGVEPPTSGSTIRRSSQLSYSCMPFDGRTLKAPAGKCKLSVTVGMHVLLGGARGELAKPLPGRRDGV
jgi:hypothetical protein